MDPPTPSAPDASAPPVREIWHLPALLGAFLLLTAALAIAVATAPEPNYTRLLRGAEIRIEHERYDEALAVLNKGILPYLDEPGFSPDHRRRFHILRARAIHLGQRALGIDKDENHDAVIGEYLEAERRNARLSPRDVQLLARSLIGAGMPDRALDRAVALPDEERDRRIAIIRDIVRAKIGPDQRDPAGALDLLARLLGDPRLHPDQRAWALARQAELLIDEGYHDEAIAKLLRAMPRLPDRADPSALGELAMLLGRAYLRTGAVEEATKHLRRALDRLIPGEPIRAEAMVLLALCDERRGDLRDARDRFATVIEDFGTEPAVMPALLGLGRVLAQLGEIERSREVYRTLVDTYKEDLVRHRDVDDDAIGDGLLDRYAERLAAGRTDQALEYALLAEDLYGIDGAPDEVVRALAEAHRRLAEERLGEIGTGLDRVINLAELDPATRAQARRHFIAAGSYYTIFANRVTISDNEEYADALWYAADCFDAGGDRAMAIRGFQRYANEIPGDPRQAEARFRLAQAYQARGDYAEAAKIYQELINAGDDREGGKGVGPFARASFVPLAQTYLLDLDESNDAEAEQLLRRVTSGAMGTAEATYFKQGLITLGRLYYQSGRYPRAIEKLEEAVARYPEDDDLPSLEFILADAYRLEAESIAGSLRDAMPDHERRALEDQRRDHLRRAMALYDEARDGLEAKDPAQLEPVERTYMRNAYFYIGACAFDLADYDAAIAHYNTARERFPGDPSSLVAMIQIVHAYLKQGRLQSARTANERAKRFYESLPPEAWDDPMLPMRRADWERWLDLTARLEERAAAGD